MSENDGETDGDNGGDNGGGAPAGEGPQTRNPNRMSAFRARAEKTARAARVSALKAGGAASKTAKSLGAGFMSDARGLARDFRELFGANNPGESEDAPGGGRDSRARGLYDRARQRAESEQAARGEGERSMADVPAIRAERRSGARAGAPVWRNSWVVETASVAGSLGAAALIAFLFAAFVVIAPRVDDDADLWSVNRPPSIVILDRNGDEIASRGSRYGKQVSIDELPDYLVKAILSTEDRRYYEHRGVDLRGTLRALVTNLREGEVVEGGSTITQQLARNLFLSMEQTYTRKAKEALLALWLEGRYTKDQLLELYLNRIYFGAGAYGVDAAAKTYFSKSARDVTLAEAVMLAGLPKAPSSLAPTQNPYGAQSRANEVLRNLRETGQVTEFEAREARQNPPVITGGAGDVELGYFFDYISALAREIAGPRDGGDLIIQTTLDSNMQQAAQAAVAAVIGVDQRLAGAEQAALVAYGVDGAMRAMVGGRSYIESQFNRAVQAKRQPGSAFKPFVYAAALEAGVTPQTVFVDQPIDIDGWKPTNYTPGYQGRMRVTEALSKSVNTIAVQVSELIGRENVAAMARRLGIRSDIPAVASIALGGVNVTLDELTAAYLPFADEGLKPRSYVIERIEDQNLQVIYQHEDEAPLRVLQPDVAENMTHLLFQVMNSGTGAGASLGARVSAGKTGTTNDWRDAWFIGYTAQVVAGVWVGNDDFTPMDHVTGGTLPARIWREFMLAAHQGLPRKPLKGAYPAPAYGDEAELLTFYRDVSSGFREVRRDGDERRGRRRR